MGSIIDDFRFTQDWGPDGYKCEVEEKPNGVRVKIDLATRTILLEGEGSPLPMEDFYTQLSRLWGSESQVPAERVTPQIVVVDPDWVVKGWDKLTDGALSANGEQYASISAYYTPRADEITDVHAMPANLVGGIPMTG